ALVKAIEKRNKEQAAHAVTEYITLFKRIDAKNGEKK
ncbi:FadR family transcriptional regulator, partial [Listeria monocytogenes]|nr:FadR family transcriptional regulator [Listeria monocytogenes]